MIFDTGAIMPLKINACCIVLSVLPLAAQQQAGQLGYRRR